MGKVILIRHRRDIRQNPALRDLRDEDGMRLKFDFLNNLRGNQRIRSPCHIGQSIRRTAVIRKVSKLIRGLPALESELFEQIEGCILCQNRDIEHPGLLDHVMRVAVPVDRHLDPVRLLCNLDHRIDDAPVILLPIPRCQNEKTIAELEHRLGVQHRCAGVCSSALLVCLRDFCFFRNGRINGVRNHIQL